MQIFKQIKSSVYDPSFYSGLRSQPLSYSFKYFFKFILICAVLAAIFLSIVLVPKLRGFSSNFTSGVINNFPADLAVTFTDGKVSTNVTEPYTIPMPNELAGADTMGKEGDKANLLVVDTNTPFSLEQYNSYNTVAWLTKDSLITTDNKGIRIVPISDIPNMTVDRAKVTEWSRVIKPLASVLTAVLPLLVIGAVFLGLIFQLVYLLLASLVVWLASKAFKLGLTYGKSYQMSLHAITLPILAFGVLSLVHVVLPIPFLPTLLLLIIVVVNLRGQGTGAASSSSSSVSVPDSVSAS